MPCEHCNHNQYTRVKSKNADGSWRIWDLCRRCGKNFRGWKSIPQNGLDLDKIPEYYRYAPSKQEPCIVRGCTYNDTQWHHFAPSAIFGFEADSWPAGYVCHKHHREWHDKVTPDISKQPGVFRKAA